jgi:hypothetical protein
VTLTPNQRYIMNDILVVAVPIEDGWWQLTDVAWQRKVGDEPWIWSVSPEGIIYEGMVISGKQPPYRTTGADTGLTLRDLQQD